MNNRILELITSTGLILEQEEKIYLFYDRYCGFIKNSVEQTYFFNNLHHDINNLKIIDISKFFYYYPLQQENSSLFDFFRFFLLNFKEYKKKYSSFIWNIGKLALKDTYGNRRTN